LAQVVTATQASKYKEAFLNGFNYLLEAQYPNGGWPQYFPLRKGYYTHITFNDDAMIGVLYLMKDIADQKPEFKFLADDQIKQAQTALLKGIDIILKTQITVEGKLTAWCAQHDEVTLAPADARSYELASISGKESIAILEFLMSIENPSNEIQQAIHSACRWYEESKIVGFRLEYIRDSTATKGFNRLLIEDTKGPDLWARFYSLKSGQPLWVDRNGIIRETHNDISAERSNKRLSCMEGEKQVEEVRSRKSEVGRLNIAVRCSILDALDVGCSMLDAGYWMYTSGVINTKNTTITSLLTNYIFKNNKISIAIDSPDHHNWLTFRLKILR